ncbi:MAG: GDSL-type esterase/lipase family protein [Paludibacter sp.]|nr:GDSL-type esterase/lipase family protein [Paludibacter sp.]
MKKTPIDTSYYINTAKMILFIWMCFYSYSFAQETPTQKIYETENYKSRTAQFRKEGLDRNQIVFLGNSLTQGGKWSVWFPELHPVNRGISGDNTEGVLARLDEVTNACPSKIFIMIGINDISQNYNTDYLCKNFKKIVQRIKKESPGTTIYIQSLLPVNNSFGRYKKLINKEKQIETLNKQLKNLCKREKIQYVDLYPLFLQKRRTLNSIYTTDGLHLNDAGYQVWTDAIRSLVEK